MVKFDIDKKGYDTEQVDKFINNLNGFINNEDDGQGDFYCLNIETMEGNVTIVWRL